jgi:hypothetical protein
MAKRHILLIAISIVVVVMAAVSAEPDSAAPCGSDCSSPPPGVLNKYNWPQGEASIQSDYFSVFWK